jgi:hypothetical protein
MPDNSISLEHTAEDKRAGMTLGALWVFAQEALAHGIDPRTPVKVTTGWRMQIQKLEAGGRR